MKQNFIEFFILCCLQCLHLLLKLYFALFLLRSNDWGRRANPKEAKEGSHLKQRPNYSLDFQAELSASGPTSPHAHVLTCRRGLGKTGAGRRRAESFGHLQKRRGRPGSRGRRKAESGSRDGKRSEWRRVMERGKENGEERERFKMRERRQRPPTTSLPLR